MSFSISKAIMCCLRRFLPTAKLFCFLLLWGLKGSLPFGWISKEECLSLGISNGKWTAFRISKGERRVFCFRDLKRELKQSVDSSHYVSYEDFCSCSHVIFFPSSLRFQRLSAFWVDLKRGMFGFRYLKREVDCLWDL